MSNRQRFELWDFTEEYSLNESTSVVRNNNNGIRMIKKIMDKSLYNTHIALSCVKNENLALIYDCRIINDNCVVLEEFINGETLESIIEKSGGLNEETAAGYMLGICNGLTGLHSNGIIHRDITPSNVMITYDGKIKIIDFDIARIPDMTAAHDTAILGTVGYAAPEQFGFRQTDVRCDIYAAGVLFNYMLTKQLPGESVTQSRYKKIISKCTSIDPENRYLTAKKLKKDICIIAESENRPLKKIIRTIPGFRTKNPLYAFFAIYFYMMALGSQAAFIRMWIKTDILKTIEYTAHFQFLFTLPFIFFTDFMSISKKLPYTRKLNRKKRKIIFAVAGSVSLITGLYLLIYLSVPA